MAFCKISLKKYILIITNEFNLNRNSIYKEVRWRRIKFEHICSSLILPFDWIISLPHLGRCTYHSEKIDTGISIIKNSTPPNHKILFIDHLHRINFNRNQLDIASSDKNKNKTVWWKDHNFWLNCCIYMYIDQKRDLWEIHVYTCT